MAETSVDVYHFDFYSVALAKIHRGNEKDYDDVIAMINGGLVEFSMLEESLHEILPDYEFFTPRADPQVFRNKFDLLKVKLFER